MAVKTDFKRQNGTPTLSVLEPNLLDENKRNMKEL